jgi:UDP:flavonoid glycosyltransferase YjiC (YdhE family)
MRVIVNVAGGYGHLYPLVPLAHALASAGHDVLVAAPLHVGRAVEEVGLEALPLPEGAEPSDAFLVRQAVNDPSDRRRAALARYLAMAVLQVPALQEAARDWQPDVLIRESTAWAAWLTGELLDLPVVVVDVVPSPTKMLSATVGRLFADARAQVGLPPDPGLTTLLQWLHVVAAPPEWLPAASVGPTTHLFRPPEDPPATVRSPAWLDALDESRPLVYVTLGTVVNRTPGAFELIFEGLANLPVNVVATVGPDVDPRSFGSLPSHIRVERFISQAAVLPRAAAVVCHAGYGSLMGALRHGVPVVTVPLANADGAANAARVRALGVGIEIPEGGRSAEAVQNSVRAVLAETTYQESARRLARSMEALPPLAAASSLVERVAVERRPILTARAESRRSR